LVLCLYCTPTLAQKEATQPVSKVLKSLEERYEVQFNYASSLVENVRVVVPKEALPSLTASLDYLNNQTDLNFVLLSDNIVTITPKEWRFCGYLKDRETGETLPYVTVKAGDDAAITNEAGFFELQGLRKDTPISIRHLGYRPLEDVLQNFTLTNCEEIYLVFEPDELTEVVVFNFLVRGIDQLDNGTIQLDMDRFNILPGLVENDVLLSIQALPGVISIDETVSNINIRGGSNDQNLISWDGIKMYQSGHFFGLISMYNPEITQKVSLRKNGSSVVDTDGVSGTIAMKTKQTLTKKLKASLGSNLIDVNGAIDTPLGKRASIQMAGRKSISDFVETPTYANYFERISQQTELERNNFAVANSGIAFDFYDASLRLLYYPSDKDRIRLNFIHTANELTFNENAIIAGIREDRQSKLDQSTLAAGVYYKRAWTGKLDTELSAYNTDYKLKAINADILQGQRFLQENKVSETGIKLLMRNWVNARFNWINGYQFGETKITNLDDVDVPFFRSLKGEVLRTHALFSEVGYASKSAATQLNLGLRYNYLENFKKQIWEPRLSFTQLIEEYLRLEVLGEFKHQNSSQVINFQNDFIGLEKRRWQLSNNENIPVITSKQYSVGLNYNKDGWLINGISFFKGVNGITSQSQGFQGPYEFTKSTGSYEAAGLDLLVRKQFNKDNSMWISYSYLKSDYRFPQLEATTLPNNFEITHGLTTGFNYTLGKFLLATGLNWRTGRPFTPPVSGNEVIARSINYDAVNEARLKDYLRLDFSARYELQWGGNNRAQIGLAIWNLTNKNNTINTFYRVNSAAELQRIDQRSLGITPNASIKVFFN